MERARLMISGRVQGVLFRDFTQRWASSFELKGWVKNLPDGRVEVLVEGDKDKINRLITKLRKGPQMARVDDIDLDWREYKGEYSDFRITW
ncbi:MAG: acylphosphatase [Candidatus Aminicenantes bacterium]|nr:acylphosphatase [Candidatus Aminicenantes bacterium]